MENNIILISLVEKMINQNIKGDKVQIYSQKKPLGKQENLINV